MIVYKGFNSDWTCQGFRYKFGEEYVHEGELVMKQSGFHSSPNPLYILNHYQPWVGSRLALVEISGEIVTHPEIFISSKIKLLREVSLEEMVDIWLDTKPDLSQIDSEGQSFLDIARRYKLKSIEEKLKEVMKGDNNG